MSFIIDSGIVWESTRIRGAARPAPDVSVRGEE
jgi:hypothetical protein